MTVRKVRIILQARTNSSRLPAKALLPLAGVPLAILCARRLASRGREVWLATSDSAQDDLLAGLARNDGIHVFRGSLEDVADRFVRATADLSNSDLVVRATADNPVPDGDFIDKLIRHFDLDGTSYLGTSSPGDGLPYGLSAEVFTVEELRRSMSGAIDPLVREHVTVGIRKQAGTTGILPRQVFFQRDLSHLRVTIDTLDDYLSLASLFLRFPLLKRALWKTLIEYVEQGTATDNAPAPRCNVCPDVPSPMLGTAQLGLDYGIANRSGRPSDEEARQLVCSAIEAGVSHIDTARAYGDAEVRLGRILSAAESESIYLVSKLCPMTEIRDDASVREINNAVDASVYGSCHDLNRSCIEVMMFHRSADIHRWSGAAVDRLQYLCERGVIREIGASIYTPDEAVSVLRDKRIRHVQIPFNILDVRWLNADFQRALATRDDVKVHARSIFLQGLLLNTAEVWPSWMHRASELVSRLDTLTQRLNRRCKADLCIAYVRSCAWLFTFLVGAETTGQIKELLGFLDEPVLLPEEVLMVQNSFNDVPVRLLNPAQWK